MSASPAQSPLLFLVANERPAVASVHRRGEDDEAGPFAALFAGALGDGDSAPTDQTAFTEATLAATVSTDETEQDDVLAEEAAVTELPVNIEPGTIIDGALSAQQAANAAVSKRATRAVAATPASGSERALPATPATPAEIALTSRAAGAMPATPASRDADGNLVGAQPAIPATPATRAEDVAQHSAPAAAKTAESPLRGLERAISAGAAPPSTSRPNPSAPLPDRGDGIPSRPDKNPDTSPGTARNASAATPAIAATPAQPGDSRAQPAQPAVPGTASAATTPSGLREQAAATPPTRAGTTAAEAASAIVARGVVPGAGQHSRATSGGATPAMSAAARPAAAVEIPVASATPAAQAPTQTPAPTSASTATIGAKVANTPGATASEGNDTGEPAHAAARRQPAQGVTDLPSARVASSGRDGEPNQTARTHVAPTGNPAAPMPTAAAATSNAPAAALGAATVAVASARHAEHVERSRSAGTGRRDPLAPRGAAANPAARNATANNVQASERSAVAAAASDIANTDLGVEHSVTEATAAPAMNWTGASLARFQGLPPSAPLPAFGLNTPRPDSPDFPELIGERLQWLVDRRIGHAEIRVAPPDLGVIEVKLQVEGDQVKVEFHSPSNDVRQALEAGLPRLRELLDAQGLTLTQSDIGRQARERDQGATGGAERGADKAQDAAATAPGNAPARARKGLLDEYA